MKAKGCPWCGRIGSTCWVMPCLRMQTALDTSDDKSMAKWARAVGVSLQNSHTRKVLA